MNLNKSSKMHASKKSHKKLKCQNETDNQTQYRSAKLDAMANILLHSHTHIIINNNHHYKRITYNFI